MKQFPPKIKILIDKYTKYVYYLNRIEPVTETLFLAVLKTSSTQKGGHKMPTTKVILSVLSGLVFIYAFYPYIKAIVRGDTSPRKATWLVWATGDIIILVGMIAKGTISGLLVGASIGATTTFILLLKFGKPGWTKLEKLCVGLSTLSIALWIYFGESNLGIGFNLLALAIAAWPTYQSAWTRPENEDRKTWIAFNISSAFGALAIPHLTFAEAAPALMFVAIDLPMLYILFIRPYFQKGERSLWKH